MKMLFEEEFVDCSTTVKALLINIAVEKRNAQLICTADGQGLDSIMSYALENNDQLMLKLAYNISMHGESISDMFLVSFIQIFK